MLLVGGCGSGEGGSGGLLVVEVMVIVLLVGGGCRWLSVVVIEVVGHMLTYCS